MIKDFIVCKCCEGEYLNRAIDENSNNKLY